MSTLALSVPAEWKAPSEDGGFLIWPGPRELVEQTRRNQRSLQSCEALIQNVPLRELRQEQRRWLGHAEDGRPLIANGHQVELYHPGVWAKDVLMDELAAKVEGEAYHFAVDTDAPKHMHVRWPGGSEPITDDPRLSTAHWVGVLESPTPAHIENLRGEFGGAAAKWDFAPMLDRFLGSLKRLDGESPNLALNLVDAIHEIDWSLGLRHHALAASPIWQSPGYLAFAYHILARAGEFAAIYNSTLAEYRREMGIGSPGRPWPDLRISADDCEAPFWCDDLVGQKRSRCGVRRREGEWAIECGGEQLALDSSAEGWSAGRALGRFLAAHSMRLSPRAVTLTMFLRLLVADQFVHGVGGARYDRITDWLMRRFLGIDPPAFSVTTATLLFPGAASRRLVDVNALRLEGRRLRHGWADPEKRQVARGIAQLPRGSRDRQQRFHEMHEGLLEAMRRPPYSEWQQRFEKVQHLQDEQSELFDRELFFLIQSEARLEGLIQRYHGEFS